SRRREELYEKYQELKAGGKLDSFMAKKRKRNAAREHTKDDEEEEEEDGEEDEEEEDEEECDDQSPVEEVALTVATFDDPSLPCLTWRVVIIGSIVCALLAFINQYFWFRCGLLQVGAASGGGCFRTQSIIINPIAAIILSLYMGRLLARIERRFNPDALPFSVKEHVLIGIFANCGSAFGNGNAYAIDIVTIMKQFYDVHLAFFPAFLLVTTTQVLGYGWAGMFRRYLVEPAHMWWPTDLVYVSLYRTLHESDTPARGMLTRAHFFFLITALSFCWYLVPGYLIPIVSCLSWVCWVWPASITAQQLGSGLRGMGLGAITLDWATMSEGHGSGSEGHGSGSEGHGSGSEGHGSGSEGHGSGSEGHGSGSEGHGSGSEGHGSGSEGHGSGSEGHGSGSEGHGSGSEGHGSGSEGHGSGSEGHGSGSEGHGSGSEGHGSGSEGHGSGSEGHGSGSEGHGSGSEGHGSGSEGHGSGSEGHGSGSEGHGSGSEGHGSGSEGHGSGSEGHGSGSEGHGSGSEGHGSGSEGHGSGCNHARLGNNVGLSLLALPLLRSLDTPLFLFPLPSPPNQITPHPPFSFSPPLPTQPGLRGMGLGLRGMGLGAITLDWATMSAFLSSPLAAPWFAILNVGIGFALFVYVLIPICYWGNVFAATRFPFLSSGTYQWSGDRYPVQAIITPDFRLNETMYTEQNLAPYISVFFALCYGLGFAALTATVVHVALWYGPEIYQRTMSAATEVKPDVHTRLMQRYPKVPWWWFLLLLLANIAVCIAFLELNAYFQLPWWGLLLSAALSLFFTLPIGIVTATTNQQPGLNIITEMIWGYIRPGEPIGNVCFKTYGYISMTQAIAFLQDFKLGHYMKIPPQAMFLVQVFATILAGLVNLGTSWWLYDTVENGLICKINDENFPENSPWTCPTANVFYSASIIWGLIGPERMFGPTAFYNNLNWWFLGGALAPIPFWAAHKMWPRQVWLTKVHIPVMLTGVGMMPPASPINYLGWLTMGFIFNKLIFTYRKDWWRRYNYVLLKPLQFPSPGGVLV
ncbi:unnamed protein product, partial [Closterium sp. Naga37s-1]